MFELPLFPLHTVLFPGMLLPLHIFEARYKQMIRRCLESDQLFGVVLIKNGSEALGPLAEPYLIGCTARIIESKPLEEGRLEINTVGENRFRILKLHEGLPYLVGEVEDHPYTIGKQGELKIAADQLSPKVSQYIHLLKRIEEFEFDPDGLPSDPLQLANFAAALLQMPPGDKQTLLEADSVLDLLETTNRFYTREIAFLRAIIQRGRDQSKTPISQN
jgi:Lon protease-like protein